MLPMWFKINWVGLQRRENFDTVGYMTFLCFEQEKVVAEPNEVLGYINQGWTRVTGQPEMVNE